MADKVTQSSSLTELRESWQMAVKGAESRRGKVSTKEK